MSVRVRRVHEEFAERYEAEPAAPEAAGLLDHVRELATRGTVTPLTAATSPEESHASVPARLLQA